MSENKALGVDELPLTEKTARKIINDLAENHTQRIKWSKRSVFREGPYLEPNGHWKFNLKGMAAGKIIELVVALKNHHDNPSSILVTIWME